MIHTQIQHSEDQIEWPKEVAVQRAVSMAELIRQAVDQWLRTAGSVSRAECQPRALAVAGLNNFSRAPG